MHIGFQRSGRKQNLGGGVALPASRRGRGEYEIVGSLAGYTAASLEGWTIQLYWPDDKVRETDLGVDSKNGKPRLRSLRDRGHEFQIGRMVAAMLMLPDPTRDWQNIPATIPFPLEKKYLITRIGFSPETEFTGIQDIVTVHPNFVELSDGQHQEIIGVNSRVVRIQKVYANVDRLPDDLRDTVLDHRDYMISGSPVDVRLTAIVHNIQTALHTVDSQVNAEADPLPGLEMLLNIERDTAPDLPPPNLIGEELPDIRRRAGEQYRLAKSRGVEGQRFRELVVKAYDYKCAFCGARLGGVEGIRSGVDAAHILPWGKYDVRGVNAVVTGIGLCKLHHWAFDEGIYLPVFEAGQYVLAFSSLAEEFDTYSLSRLGTNHSAIQRSWLPKDQGLWPSPELLNQHYQELEIDIPV